MSKLPTTLSALLLVAGFSGCATTSQNSPETTPDKVLARIDGLTERPNWFSESEAFVIRNGEVASLGSSTIPGDQRIEAAIRIAENNAKAGLCKVLEQRLEFVFQNAEEGASVDATQARFIGSEACKLTTSSMRPGRIYWEKVATTSERGERLARYRVFATITMPEAEFKQAILDAARKQSQGPQFTRAFEKTVNAQWDRLSQESAR